MSNTDAKLKVAELDFDQIKANLKEFLKSQSEFSDYNFEGSGLSVLLDVLAYNTHYMGYYLNMVSNEMFIDTALLRPSVVSHAKLLGYTPRSRVASQATVDIAFQEVVGGSNSSMTIPRFTRFISSPKDGVSYTFVSIEDRIAQKDDEGNFSFPNIQLKEGQPLGITFQYDQQTNSKQLFELPNIGIDISTLQVQVQKSEQNANIENFILAENSTTSIASDPVFFVEENRNGKYQIYFGDGIIGKSLTHGNIVIVSYVVTSGDAANAIKTFELIDDIKPGSDKSIVLVSESSSGRMEESIDSIKFAAPKSFIAQNRAVTKNDYIALINKNYPYFDSVAVWGGEENTPPAYGKIFFSVKPRGNYEVTTNEIDTLKNKIIKPISVLTVTPEYVAPDYNYLNFFIDVVYDPRKTIRTVGTMQSVIRGAVLSFASENLNTFNNTFKLSRLMRLIDDLDPSIENNSVKILIEKRFKPLTNQSKSYKIDFFVPLKRGTATDRILSTPSFGYTDEIGIERVSYIEEVPQSFTGIDEIEILASGEKYTDIPSVLIIGDGEGASAVATIVNGKLKNVTVTNPGSGYSAAVITVNGGSGSGAECKAVLQGRRGSLRIFYFDTNNIKRIINHDVGTIFYNEGYIQLDNFNPSYVNDPFGTMTFKGQPNTNVFSTQRNALLTLDSTDPIAITINVNSI